MTFTENCNEVFDRATAGYHITDTVDAPLHKSLSRRVNRRHTLCKELDRRQPMAHGGFDSEP